SEVPYLGAAFRKVDDITNEVELLIMVTPELVEGMDANEVPPCGPGMATTTPSDWELYLKGHLEVPNCCPNGNNGSSTQYNQESNGAPTAMPEDGMIGPEQILTPTPSATRNAAPQPSNKYSAGKSTSTSRRQTSGKTSSYNRYASSNRHNAARISAEEAPNGTPGFIGPIGYDVEK
ncbi:MAG: hypothetical protein ACWGMZ_09885, partial [Thermoguttaceae bacterium]